MRIAFAAPLEMEAYIEELKEQLVYNLLPYYVSTHELKHFCDSEFLSPNNYLYSGLLDEALQVISSLQIIIAVIKSIKNRIIQKNDRIIFEKNVQILKKYGFSFPFPIDYFSKENNFPTYPPETTYNNILN